MPSLLEDVGAVALDGLDAEHERRGDLLRAVSLSDQLEHLELAWRERLEVLSLRSSARVDDVADQRVDGGGVEERLAAHRCAAGVDDVVVGSGLQDVAGGACLQRLEEELLVVVHREDQDAQLGPASRELAGCLEAGLARHADVEDREVDVVLERALDRLRAVGGLGDDVQVGLGG